jgi:hypothetical protein
MIDDEKEFLKLIQGVKIKRDPIEFPNSVFLFKDNKWLIEFRWGKSYVRYEDFWQRFEKDNSGKDYIDISFFLKRMFIKYLHCEVKNPDNMSPFYYERIEKHFNENNHIRDKELLDTSLKVIENAIDYYKQKNNNSMLNIIKNELHNIDVDRHIKSRIYYAFLATKPIKSHTSRLKHLKKIRKEIYDKVD